MKPSPSAPRTVHRLLCPLLSLGLLLAGPMAHAAPDAWQADPRGPVRLLEDAGKGDVFSLEQALPGLRDPGWRALVQARIAASRLDTGRACEVLTALLAERALDPARQARAWSMLADVAFAEGDYAAAAEATSRQRTLLDQEPAAAAHPQDAADAARMHGVARQLARVQRQQVASFEPSPAQTRRDKVGLRRADVMVNGTTQEMVLDTGANLSVVSRTTAKRLGLRLLDGEVHVGSASRDEVPTLIGIADELSFAGLRLRNVGFLVLDDAGLELPVPGGYRIEAILGFPVLRELRRIRFELDGQLVPEPGMRGTTEAPGNLRIIGSDLFVNARVNGLPVALHLDSGASASSLSPLFARRHPELTHGLPTRQEHFASAGGATSRRSAVLPAAALELDGKTVALEQIAIGLDESADVETRQFGVLGGDVLGRFSYWRVDFERMRLELGEIVPVR